VRQAGHGLWCLLAAMSFHHASLQGEFDSNPLRCLISCMFRRSLASNLPPIRKRPRRSPATTQEYIPKRWTSACSRSPTYTPMSGAVPQTTLSSLPPELLLKIAFYLPLSALISLKLTNKYTNSMTPSPPADYCFGKLSRCEQRAVQRYIGERVELTSGRQRCLLCNTLQDLRFFDDASPQVCTLQRGRFMALSPEEVGLDAWFVEQVASRIGDEFGGGGAYWVAIPGVLCLHTHVTWVWTGTPCSCGCGDCAHAQVTCFVRMSRGCDAPRTWDVVRDGSGQAWMSEEYALESEARSQKKHGVLPASRRELRGRVPIVDLEMAWCVSARERRLP